MLRNGERPVGQFGGEVSVEEFGEGALVDVEVLSERDGGLAHLPIAEAVLLPFREVLFRDGAAREFSSQNGLDFRQ